MEFFYVDNKVVNYIIYAIIGLWLIVGIQERNKKIARNW